MRYAIAISPPIWAVLLWTLPLGVVIGIAAVAALLIFIWAVSEPEILDLRECDIIETPIRPHADNVTPLRRRG